MKTLLFADPDGSAILQDVLRRRGHEVELFALEERAWDAYQEAAHPLVVLGPGCREHEALALCRRIRALPEGRRAMILTALPAASAEALNAFWEAGSDDFLIATDAALMDARLRVIEREAAAIDRRREAERSLRDRVRLEELISSISTNFINIEPDEVDRGIQRALKAVGEFARADRSYVFLLTPDGQGMNNTHEWCAPGVQPEIHNLQGMSVDAFPWWMNRLRRLEVILIPRVRDLPPEARAERDAFEAQSIQGLVGVPLVLGRTLKGFIGLDLVKAEGVFAEGDVRLLKTIGDIFVNALERRRTEEALMKSEERFRRLVENAADAFFVADLSGAVLDVNQRACESLGWTRGELLSMKMGQLETAGRLDAALAGWADARSAVPLTVEIEHLRKDGARFPAEARVTFFEEAGRPLAFVLVRDISERKRNEARLETLNRVFLGLGGDIEKNIQSLTRACGELLGADMALYSRVEGDDLVFAASWNVPRDFPSSAPAAGLVCNDVATGNTGTGVCVVEDLAASTYWQTDPYVSAYNLQVYAGKAVWCLGRRVGVLCVAYGRKTRFGDDLSRLLEIFASALSVEEERRFALEKLRQSEERFRQVTESIREVFYLASTEKPEMIYINPAYEAIWGRPAESLYESPRSWLDAVHPDDRNRVFEAMMAKHPRGMEGLDDVEYRIVRPDGGIRWIRDRSFPIRNAEGRVYRVAGIAEDITDRKQMEREVVEISGREQRRIGQDLHDGLGQSLTGIAFLSKAIQERLAQKGIAEAAEMDKVVRLVNAAIVHTKGLGRGLYPVELETNGLAAALQELASQTEAVFRVPCTVETDATALAALDSEAEINLYRIAQEALTNAVKHGKASKISVRLASESGGTTLVVKDDGVGVSDTPTQQGMGLRIMNYRARVIGASLALSRSREGGTVVACTVARKP